MVSFKTEVPVLSSFCSARRDITFTIALLGIGITWSDGVHDRPLAELNGDRGSAIPQTVSSLLATAAARVRAQVRSCGICGGQSSTGVGFLRVLLFPLPILIPPTAPHPSSIIRGWYHRPDSDRRTKWTQSHPTP
jgi:hypothetical protein